MEECQSFGSKCEGALLQNGIEEIRANSRAKTFKKQVQVHANFQGRSKYSTHTNS